MSKLHTPLSLMFEMLEKAKRTGKNQHTFQEDCGDDQEFVLHVKVEASEEFRTTQPVICFSEEALKQLLTYVCSVQARETADQITRELANALLQDLQQVPMTSPSKEVQ